MRAILLLSLAALTACSNAKSETPDYQAQSKAWLTSELIKEGKSPAEAKRQADLVSEDLKRMHYDPKIQAGVARRQKEISEVRTSACKNDASLSYC